MAESVKLLCNKRGFQGRTDKRPQDRGKKDGEEDEAAAARRPVECLYDKQREDLAQDWTC